MRIVAGTARGRRFDAPDGPDTRPTTDRVREAVFNALVSLGAVDDAQVVDLFAGSGGLGLEALSRGARHVHFVESDRRAAEVITANIAGLGFADRATLVIGQVLDVIDRLPDRVDLVLADPPYRFAEWDDLLARLAGRCDEDCVVVIESDRDIDPGDGWEKVRAKSYGSTVVTFAVRADVANPTGAGV